MTLFWHPLSAVYLDEPRAIASPAIVKMILAAEGRVELVYCGDRMGPCVPHGRKVAVVPAAVLKPGDVVLVLDGGVFDVHRIERVGGSPVVAGDADPAPPRTIDARAIVGTIAGFPGRRLPRSLARAWIDLVEAATGRPDPAESAAQTVLDKYDDQAVYYGRGVDERWDAPLEARIVAEVPRGGSVLVAGSGTGREAFALEQLGYRVRGIDFSPKMVAIAQAAAARRRSGVTFVTGDLRRHEETAGSLDAVIFTYDVYSFLPGAADRVAVLARIRSWLGASGALFLSARTVHRSSERAILSLQWLSRGGRGEWGDSHTRWLDTRGRLRRSFIHVFSNAQIDREAAGAGFVRRSWEGGHGHFALRG